LLIVGWASDRFGPRVTLAFAGTLTGIGISLCSQINDLQHFYLFYGMASLGVGALWVLPNTVVMRWFDKKRGLTLGIVTAGIGAGEAVYPPVASSLILAQGWRMTYLILGIGTCLLLTVSAAFMASSPEKNGLKPYGAEEGAVESISGESHDSKVWRAGEWSLKEARVKSFK